MTHHQPQVSPTTQELRTLGQTLIQPEALPPNWPADFFDPVMDFGSTVGMTNGAKSRQFRHRALYSALRASAYEKVLSACLARTRVARTLAFLFALVWGAGMLAFNYSKLDGLKASASGAAAIVPGLGAVAGEAMTPEQARAAQDDAIRKVFGQ